MSLASSRRPSPSGWRPSRSWARSLSTAQSLFCIGRPSSLGRRAAARDLPGGCGRPVAAGGGQPDARASLDGPTARSDDAPEHPDRVAGPSLVAMTGRAGHLTSAEPRPGEAVARRWHMRVLRQGPLRSASPRPAARARASPPTRKPPEGRRAPYREPSASRRPSTRTGPTATLTEVLTNHLYEGPLRARRGLSARSRCWPRRCPTVSRTA